LSELTALIGDVVEEKLKNLNPQQSVQEPILLTRQETAKLLGVTLPTLHEWTKNGTIQGVRIGTRVRYRMPDIESALKNINNAKSKRR
jgi:excisionase family DNA binding protein